MAEEFICYEEDLDFYEDLNTIPNFKSIDDNEETEIEIPDDINYDDLDIDDLELTLINTEITFVDESSVAVFNDPADPSPSSSHIKQLQLQLVNLLKKLFLCVKHVGKNISSLHSMPNIYHHVVSFYNIHSISLSYLTYCTIIVDSCCCSLL